MPAKTVPQRASRGRQRGQRSHQEPAKRRPTRRAAVRRERNLVQRIAGLLGPGLITGASDDDPSGIGTYAVAGAKFGYGTLWTVLVCFPLMTCTQIICSRIGQVTGRGLAGVLRHHYPRVLVYPMVAILVTANTINAGTDIGAIAAAINLLVPVPVALMIVPIGAAILLLQIFGSYRLITAIFKWLTLALLAYVAAAFFARPDAGDVSAHTFIPTVRLDAEYITILVALLGTTITPYLWFWQASQEVEEEISEGKVSLADRRGATTTEKRYADWNTVAGMFSSQVVTYFIILTTGATLYLAGQRDISSAAEAAEALRPLAGSAATILLAAGLIGAGLLAVPILTGSAAYAVAETFDWKYGLDRKLAKAKQFYGVIAASTIVGLAINFLGINPITALFWTAVINGLIAPPLLFIVMLLANNEGVMGGHRPGRLVAGMGWATVAAMALAAAAMLLTL